MELLGAAGFCPLRLTGFAAMTITPLQNHSPLSLAGVGGFSLPAQAAPNHQCNYSPLNVCKRLFLIRNVVSSRDGDRANRRTGHNSHYSNRGRELGRRAVNSGGNGVR